MQKLKLFIIVIIIIIPILFFWESCSESAQKWKILVLGHFLSTLIFCADKLLKVFFSISQLYFKQPDLYSFQFILILCCDLPMLAVI